MTSLSVFFIYIINVIILFEYNHHIFMSQSGELAVLALNDISPYEAISNFTAGCFFPNSSRHLGHLNPKCIFNPSVEKLWLLKGACACGDHCGLLGAVGQSKRTRGWHSLWPVSGRPRQKLPEKPDRSPERTEQTLDRPAGERGPAARGTCRWKRTSAQTLAKRLDFKFHPNQVSQEDQFPW